MSPTHPFNSLPIQLLNRQPKFPVQRLFEHREWTIAGQHNLLRIQGWMVLAACTQGGRAFLDNVVDQVHTKRFFTLQSIGIQEFGTNKHEAPVLYDEAGQPAVRYIDPEQIAAQPFPASCRFQPEVEQTKAGHIDFLWKQSDRFTKRLVLFQNGFLNRHDKHNLGTLAPCLMWGEPLPGNLDPGQWQQMFLTQTPANQRLLLFRLRWELFQL